MLVTETQGRSHSRGPKNFDKGRSKSRGKYANVECYHCHEKGHTKKFYRKLKWENKKKKKSQKHDNDSNGDVGSIATITEELIVVCDNDAVNLVSNDETIGVPDSNSTIHATSRRDLFTSYTPGDCGVEKMRNNGRAKIIGKGDIHLETTNDTRLILKSMGIC